ncbi:MAG: nucleotide-binding protein [Euryarchaeota archaeon]
MANNFINKINDLIIEVEKNKYDSLDVETFDSIYRRAIAICRNAFGENSLYETHFRELGQWSSIDKSKLLKILLDILYQLKLGENIDINSNLNHNNKMFIVHGHDDEMKLTVARTIEKLGLAPIILHEQPNKGRTIIEKFFDSSDVSFAVVLLSPDDMGYSKKQGSENTKSRARQNVILELGFFLGKLGRERVFVLYKNDKNFEIPSDYDGVLYIQYDDDDVWKNKLLMELKACGYDIDANNNITNIKC